MYVYGIMYTGTTLEGHFKYSSHKKTATQNEVALSYHRVRGQYSQAVVFEATIGCRCNAQRVKTENFANF